MLRAAATASDVSRLTLRVLATLLTVLEKIRSALKRMVITTASSMKVKPEDAWDRVVGRRRRCMVRARGERIRFRKNRPASGINPDRAHPFPSMGRNSLPAPTILATMRLYAGTSGFSYD